MPTNDDPVPVTVGPSAPAGSADPRSPDPTEPRTTAAAASTRASREGGRRSAEAAMDVVRRALVARVAEDLGRRALLDEPTGLAERVDEEEAAVVRDPHRLLHVVRDDDDRDLVGELGDRVLHHPGRDRVEGRAGL